MSNFRIDESTNPSYWTGEKSPVVLKELVEKIIPQKEVTDDATLTVESGKLTVKNGGIGTDQLADDAVGEDKIKNEAITSDKIAAGAITRDKMDPNISFFEFSNYQEKNFGTAYQAKTDGMVIASIIANSGVDEMAGTIYGIATTPDKNGSPDPNNWKVRQVLHVFHRTSLYLVRGGSLQLFVPRGTWWRVYKLEGNAGQSAIVAWLPINEPRVAKPVMNPKSTTFETSITVTITCSTEGAAIYYTLDGTAPTSNSIPYSSPIILTATKTVKAVGIKEDMKNSNIAEEVYTKI